MHPLEIEIMPVVSFTFLFEIIGHFMNILSAPFFLKIS